MAGRTGSCLSGHHSPARPPLGPDVKRLQIASGRYRYCRIMRAIEAAIASMRRNHPQPARNLRGKLRSVKML